MTSAMGGLVAPALGIAGAVVGIGVLGWGMNLIGNEINYMIKPQKRERG